MNLRLSLGLSCMALVAALTSACSTEPGDNAGEGKQNLGRGPAECPAVAAPPADSCPNGTLVPTTDARGCVTGFACSGGTPTVECPPVAAPPADFCAPPNDGVFPTKDARGCVTGFECFMCPQVAAPPADYCADPNATIAPTKDARGCVTGFECRPPAQCPAVMLPPADACPNGTFVPRVDATGCTRGFDCVPS